MLILFNPNAEQTIVSQDDFYLYVHAFMPARTEGLHCDVEDHNFFSNKCLRCSNYCENVEKEIYYNEELEEYVEDSDSDGGCEGGLDVFENGDCSEYSEEDLYVQSSIPVDLPPHVYRVRVELSDHDYIRNHLFTYKIEGEGEDKKIYSLPLLIGNVYEYDSPESVGEICWGEVGMNQASPVDMHKAYEAFFDSVFNGDLIPSGNSIDGWLENWSVDNILYESGASWTDYTALLHNKSTETSKGNEIGYVIERYYDPMEESYKDIQGFAYKVDDRYFVEQKQAKKSSEVYEIDHSKVGSTGRVILRRLPLKEVKNLLKETVSV